MMPIYETVDEIDHNINKLKESLKELESAKTQLLKDRVTTSPAGELAIKLHSMFCNFNHTDGCSWYYEVGKTNTDWSGYAHSRYYNMAAQLLKKFKCDEVIEMCTIIKKFK